MKRIYQVFLPGSRILRTIILMRGLHDKSKYVSQDAITSLN